jgi:hypothetical protein
MGPRVADKYVIEIGLSSSKLTILLVDVDDIGAYNCRVSAADESIQAHAYLDIRGINISKIFTDSNNNIINKHKKQISVTPRDIVITGSNTTVEGEAITLICAVVASPKPTVTWLKRNARELRLLRNSSRISVTNTYDRRIFTHRSALVIQDAQEADSGEYLCEVQDAPMTLSLVSSQHINISGEY